MQECCRSVNSAKGWPGVALPITNITAIAMLIYFSMVMVNLLAQRNYEFAAFPHLDHIRPDVAHKTQTRAVVKSTFVQSKTGPSPG